MSAIDSDIPLVAEIGRHLVNSGGKRIRPALCLLAAHAGEKFDPDKSLPLAAALEMIHTASLVHDDVIDAADTRRGHVTANVKWGNQIAILSGDYIFARAFRLIADENYDRYVSKRLAELVGNLSVGEIIQDQNLFDAGIDWDGYYDRIQKKTADFLEICCELGGVIGGLPKTDTDSLAAYGHAVGMAFQITDDLLDVWQTSAALGKPAGNDLRQGIATLPTLRALEVSPRRDELAAIITDRQMTDEMLQTALSIIRSSDAQEFTQAKANDYLTKAKASLPKNLPADLRESFVAVADFIGCRRF